MQAKSGSGVKSGYAMAHAQSLGGGELHLVTVAAVVYSLKIFECTEWVTANIKTA